jgi:hypothetical protein
MQSGGEVQLDKGGVADAGLRGVVSGFRQTFPGVGDRVADDSGTLQELLQRGCSLLIADEIQGLPYCAIV